MHTRSMRVTRGEQRLMVAIAGALALTSCGADNAACVAGSGSTAIVARVGAAEDEIVLASWTAEPDDACPAADAPDGVASMTVTARQPDIDGSDGTHPFAGGGDLKLCIARPDLLATGSLALGRGPAAAGVHLVELAAVTPDCDYALDAGGVASGAVTATGLCEDGRGSGEFALAVDVTFALTGTCGSDSTVSTVTATIAGTVQVARGR